MDDCISNAGPVPRPAPSRPGQEGENLVHLERSVGSGACVCDFFCSRRQCSAPFPRFSLLGSSGLGWTYCPEEEIRAVQNIFSVTYFYLVRNSFSPPALECRSPSKIVSVRVVVSLPDPLCVRWLSGSDSATPWAAAHQASLSFTSFWSLLKRMSLELVMPSNYLILCLPLLHLPSIFSHIRVFSNESALHRRWPK